MLGHYRAIDPPCYRLVHIPQVLHRMAAHLHDHTTVYPLASGRNEVFLSRSGIMFVGDTVDQRHQHLVDLSLAGPTAPAVKITVDVVLHRFASHSLRDMTGFSSNAQLVFGTGMASSSAGSTANE